MFFSLYSPATSCLSDFLGLAVTHSIRGFSNQLLLDMANQIYPLSREVLQKAFSFSPIDILSSPRQLFIFIQFANTQILLPVPVLIFSWDGCPKLWYFHS